MTNTNTTIMTLAEFERLLDVYGGDRTRWPADARAAAAQLVARDVKAQDLLAEAEALDRLLGRAPLPSLAKEAELADRIVAAAQRTPRLVRINEAAKAPDAAAPATATQVPVASHRRAGFVRADLRKAAVLAASLFAGLYLGHSNLPQQFFTGSDVAADRYNMALADPFDEDVL
jgi:hypothetical protein